MQVVELHRNSYEGYFPLCYSLHCFDEGLEVGSWVKGGLQPLLAFALALPWQAPMKFGEVKWGYFISKF